MGRVLGRCCILIAVAILLQSAYSQAQGTADERVLYHAKIFTADPQNPYAEAVAVRGGKIVAVGNVAEAAKSVSPNAERIDLDGKSLFPGFIDSHTHSIEGGLSLIGADATDKVSSLDQLPAFVDEAKRSGHGMRGDIVEIQGLPLEFWSHPDVLNRDFSTGSYQNQSVLLHGMDGHTAWANRALLQRAGITAEFLKSLTPDERAYYGVDKSGQPTGFLVDAGLARIEPLLPKPTPEKLLEAGRAALKYNYSLGITAWLDPLASDQVLSAYKALADHGELNSEVVAFPQVLAKDPTAELAAVQQTRERYKNVAHLYVTGIKVFADGVAEFPHRRRT
jgi:predicted amidohydrolase YtcJ